MRGWDWEWIMRLFSRKPSASCVTRNAQLDEAVAKHSEAAEAVKQGAISNIMAAGRHNARVNMATHRVASSAHTLASLVDFMENSQRDRPNENDR